MTILAGDIKLLASQRMTDNDDGGGRATGTVIVSGAHNTIFDDVSDVDLAYGRVNLRQVFPAIHTDDTDKYYGANVIVLTPPASDDVSITLFDQGEPFCFRNSAREFIEQYLVKGPRWSGYLYDTQLKGQRAIRFFQRSEIRLPDVGETLVLVGDEGKPTQFEQYVRVTKVSSEVKTFETQTSNGTFTRLVVTCEISDKLRYTFPGNLPTKFDDVTPESQLRETVVADAATYYGTMAAAANGTFGSMQIQVKSIYSQLVPSARTDIPATDLSSAGQSTALIASAGSKVTFSTPLLIAPGKAIYLGNACMPGSVAISIGSATITDSAGELMVGALVVGSVEYQRGLLSFNDKCPNYGTQTKSVSFMPAAAPVKVSETAAIEVDANNRRYAYTYTMAPIPSPGSVVLSYMVQGKWYDLRDSGNGELRGADDSYGAGVIDFSTGSLMATLGNLPDVGSMILLFWSGKTVEYSVSQQPVKPPLAPVDPATPEPINRLSISARLGPGGLLWVSECVYSYGGGTGGSHMLPSSDFNRTIDPATVTASWAAGACEAHTDANGVFVGSGSGRVDGATGLLTLCPNVLPSSGDELHLTWRVIDRVTTAYPPVTVDGSSVALSLGANPKPGSVYLTVKFKSTLPNTVDDKYNDMSVTLRDDGNGNLLDVSTRAQWGSVDYVSGAVAITMPSTHKFWVQHYEVVAGDYRNTRSSWDELPAQFVAVTNATRATSSLGEEQSATLAMTSLTWNNTDKTGVWTADATRLDAAGQTLTASGGLLQLTAPETGAATTVGSVDAANQSVTLSTWPAGASNSVTAQSLCAELGQHLVSQVAFRTPGAPVAPGSLYLWCIDKSGTRHDLTIADSCVVRSGIFHGRFDYQMGIAKLTFGNRILAAGHESEPWYSIDRVDADGYIIEPVLIKPDSIRYNCVMYSYIPLDADLIGLDPVRLPSDGRVPIFRTGGLVVVHSTEKTVVPNNPTAGTVVDVGRTRLAYLHVEDSAGVPLPVGAYQSDLDAGRVTFTSSLSLTGLVQPLWVVHRVEDMSLVRDVEISGRLSLARQLSHNYPASSTLVSSVLLAGDRQARYTNLFDQATWTNEWSNTVIGNETSAQFNEVLYPITVTNRGAITEEWALIFTSASVFRIVGRSVGQIGVGDITTPCAPNNPATGVPYWSINPLAFGAGWSAGNVLRFNTIGAEFPVQVARTILQSDASMADDKFALQIRGNVNK